MFFLVFIRVDSETVVLFEAGGRDDEGGGLGGLRLGQVALFGVQLGRTLAHQLVDQRVRQVLKVVQEHLVQVLGRRRVSEGALQLLQVVLVTPPDLPNLLYVTGLILGGDLVGGEVQRRLGLVRGGLHI